MLSLPLPHPPLLSLIARRTLLCQSYRGSEWARSSLDASEITLGGFRLQLSTTVRVLSSSLQLDTLFHSRQQVNSSSFPLIIRLHHRHLLMLITKSSDPHPLRRSAPFGEPPPPPTVDPTPQFTTRISRRRSCSPTLFQRCVWGLLRANGELHISFFFVHSSLASTRGPGDRATVNAIPFHYPCGHLMWNVLFFSKKRANGPSRTIGNLRQKLASPNIFGRSKQQLSAGFDRSSESIILHFRSFWMPLSRLPVLALPWVHVQI